MFSTKASYASPTWSRTLGAGPPFLIGNRGCPTLVASAFRSDRVGIHFLYAAKPKRYQQQRCLHFITFSWGLAHL